MTCYMQRVIIVCIFMSLTGIDSTLSYANITNPLSDETYGKTWMYFPNDAGVPTIAYLEDDSPYTFRTQDDSSYATSDELDQKVKFILYTSKKAASVPISLKHMYNVYKSLDFSKDIKFITHGYLSDSSSRICQVIKNAYLKHGDINVILVDWSEFSSNILYPFSASSTEDVGRHLAKFIDRLIEGGANASRIHLIGHSLGSHVSGYAGKSVTKGRIGRITGLDPARPMFVNSNLVPLQFSDADFVDVIHTCSNVLGFAKQLGHADFYPNGGVPPQPGCLGFSEIVQGCSHGRSYEYFAESIDKRNKYTALKCSSWEDFLQLNCDNQSAMMGEHVARNARGRFYLHTNPSSPYCSELYRM